jgi:hypothetical protein
MKKLSCGILVGIIAMVGGCSRGPSFVPKYGVAYNAEREKRGIPIIEPTWTIEDFGYYFDCLLPNLDNLDETKPHTLGKRVFIDQKGIIASEGDSFCSGKTYLLPSGKHDFQEVNMEYQYAAKKEGGPWTMR